MILVVTDVLDATANNVISQLNHAGEKWARFNASRFPNDIQIDYSPLSPSTSYFIDEFGDKYCIGDVKSVLIWKPDKHVVSNDLDECEADFVRDACYRTFLSFLGCLHENCFVVNSMYASRRANDKGVQLRLAQKVGLKIPDTLITNSPKSAKNFCESKKDVIFKLINKPFIDYGAEAKWFSSNLLTKDDINDIDGLGGCPGIFQPRVMKAFDLRITVVGDEVFPVEIHSQVDPRTAVDFRLTWSLDIPLKHVIHDLPNDIKQKCIELTKSLGLRYCAIDMIVTPDHDYIFLEVNPAGQWGWIEVATKLPITRAMTEMLLRGGL